MNGKQASADAEKALLPGGRLWDPMLRFMERFDPVQIRYGGPELGQLIEALEKSARLASLVSLQVSIDPYTCYLL